MAQHYGSLDSHTRLKAQLDWAAERRMLLDNLWALRESSAALAMKTQELKNLLKTVELNLADAQSIQLDLNETAISFGLQPIAARGTKP